MDLAQAIAVHLTLTEWSELTTAERVILTTAQCIMRDAANEAVKPLVLRFNAITKDVLGETP